MRFSLLLCLSIFTLVATWSISAHAQSPPESSSFKLISDDGAAGDWFGRSVATDGNTVIVGADAADIDGVFNQGAAYVFVRDGDEWVQQTKLIADDGASSNQFGMSVALSGNTALIGTGGPEAAYVFVREGDTWTQQAKLTTDDGAANDGFGYAVALEGDVAAIAARQANVGPNNNQGAVYVFSRDGDTWTQDAKLIADDGDMFNLFGYSVAISGNTVVAGAAFHDTDGNTNQGAAYVYAYNGTEWAQEAKLVADDGMAGDRMGSSVAAYGDMILVGADHSQSFEGVGAAYIFIREGNTWTQAAQLIDENAAAGDWFGFAVALEEDLAVVNARLNIDGNVSQGGLHVFSHSGGIWNHQHTFIAEDGGDGDLLGESVALSGLTAVGGAVLADVDGNVAQGAAYVFEIETTEAPSAHIDLTELAFELPQNQVESASVTLSNAGGADLDFLISFDETRGTSLISVDPASGVVAPGESEALSVTVDSEGADPGTYTFEMLIETNDPKQPVLVVDISVTVKFVSTDNDGDTFIFALEQNYPNPFTDRTTFAYSLAEAGPVNITVYDALGRRVATLVDGIQNAGQYTVEWDVHDVSGGVYFYRLQAGTYEETQRALIVQ